MFNYSFHVYLQNKKLFFKRVVSEFVIKEYNISRIIIKKHKRFIIIQYFTNWIRKSSIPIPISNI